MKSNKFINFILLLLIVNFVTGENYCQLNIKNYTNPPIFLEKFGQTHRLITIDKSGILNIRAGRNVIATCGGSLFTIKDGKNSTKTHNVIISCTEEENNQSKLVVRYNHNNYNNKSSEKHVEFNKLRPNLSCDKNFIQFFNYNVKGCEDYTGVLAGFINRIYENSTNEKQLIKLVEYCYDESELRTIFAHHVIAARSPFMEFQSQYNTVDNLKLVTSSNNVVATTTEDIPNSMVELFSGNIEKLYDQNRLRKHFEAILGGIYANIALSKVNLVPDNSLPLQFKSATDIYLNAAIQWTGLKDGNWCKVQEDIKNIVQNDVAVIYTGTSGVIGLQDSWNKFQHLFVNTEQMLEASMPVPLYYWTLVKTQSIYNQQSDTGDYFNNDGDSNYNKNNNYNNKEYEDDSSVVIVSINNPYLKVTDLKSYIFCSDICDYIPWLNKLKLTRKMPALGYTFCCHLDEAMEFIPEIPKHCMENYTNSDDNNYSVHIGPNDNDGSVDNAVITEISNNLETVTEELLIKNDEIDNDTKLSLLIDSNDDKKSFGLLDY